VLAYRHDCKCKCWFARWDLESRLESRAVLHANFVSLTRASYDCQSARLCTMTVIAPNDRSLADRDGWRGIVAALDFPMGTRSHKATVTIVTCMEILLIKRNVNRDDETAAD
jgi:hypothetical protein